MNKASIVSTSDDRSSSSSIPDTNMTNSIVMTMAAALFAGISAYCITAWKMKENDKGQDETSSMLLEELKDVRQRLIELETHKKKKKRRSSICSISMKTDDYHKLIAENGSTNKEVKYAEAIENIIPAEVHETPKSHKPHRNHKTKRASILDTNMNAVETESAYVDDDNEFNLLPRTIVTKDKKDKPLLIPKQLNPTGSDMDSSSTDSHDPSKYEPVPIVLISDPGQDLDDEMMFIMARHLVSVNLIDVKGVVANLHPSFARARLTRGTLDLLGLHKVPVGIGTDGGDLCGKHSSDQFENTASSYIVQEDGEAARGLESGHRLLQRLYEDAKPVQYIDVMEDGDDGSNCAVNNNSEGAKAKDEKINKPFKKVARGGLVLVITSSMKDAAIFVRDNPTMFASKTREVVVMGGCKPIDADLAEKVAEAKAEQEGDSDLYDPNTTVWSQLSKTECEADSAHNNMFDAAASDFLYSQCQKLNVTLTVVSRYAAYAAKMPRSVYDDIALTGSSIGWRLRNSQRSSIDQLWRRACSNDPKVRLGLPPRCDRKWFIATFCGGDDDESRCSEDTAWDLVTGFMQYDTLALLAAVPGVRDQYFDPFVLPPLREGREKVQPNVKSGGLKVDPTFQMKDKERIENKKEVDDEEVTVKTKSTGAVHTQKVAPKAHVRLWSRRTSDPGPGYIQRAMAQANKDNSEIEFLKSLSPLKSQLVPSAFDRGTRNLIGVSEKEHNLKDPSLLVDLLKSGYRSGILCNHHTLPHLILHMQLRWDNLADTLMTCLMLRSLWDMRLASVLGVIVTINPSDSASRPPDEGGDKSMTANELKRSLKGSMFSNPEDQSPSTLHALAETIRDTFWSIGLSHVKFIVVTGENMDDHKKQCTEALLNLYESAPPIGVSLVLTATFTSVVTFAVDYPELFRNKTVRVVHTGGALVWPARWGWASGASSRSDSKVDRKDETGDDSKAIPLTEEKILVPDPAAQNHRLDLASARMFYKQAQSLSVPMVILSRHVAKECCIPRHFFDVLGSHGGGVGHRIYQNERNSLLNLWKCSSAPLGSSARGNLPDRCDRTWFARTFCAGAQANNEEEVWAAVDSVNLYSPIALLAALPGSTLKNYFKTMPFTVRSATHHVIGLTEEVPPRNVINPGELRSLVIQSLLSAALANESEFQKGLPPKVPIRMETEHRRHYYKACQSLGMSVSSTITTESQSAAEDDDMWTFSEAARRELFSRTFVRTSRNLVLPKDRVRKFVSVADELQSLGFIPPRDDDDDDES